MLPTISILMPVYNAGKYLEQGLQSVFAQTFKDFELICVDDGSTDASAEILKTYAEKEPRLRVLTQTNAGVAAARNRLLQEARGEYIAFIDADDWVEPTYLEALYTAATQTGADLTKTFFKQYNEDTQQFEKESVLSAFFQTPCEQLASRLRAGNADDVVWGKLYKRSWLEQHHLSFLKGQVGEDSVFSVLAFLLANHITVVPEKLYVYRKRSHGAITSQSHKMDIASLYNRLCLWSEMAARELLEPQVNDLLARYVIGDICRLRKLPTDLRQEQRPVLEQAWACLDKYKADCSLAGRLRLTLLKQVAGPFGSKRFFLCLKLFR